MGGARDEMAQSQGALPDQTFSSVIFNLAVAGDKGAHLYDLQLHTLVRLRTLEAVANGLHQAVDEPLAGAPAVGGVPRDVAVSNEFLPGMTKFKQGLV